MGILDENENWCKENRLELQKMLFDIARGKINLVVLSKLSRVSRIMKDFSEIWELGT
ncbi:MAG: recombinase family protein [Bdellovibrionota bacterium]|nr:recombinase family protein [Bdellovibrionota bacterium]